MFNRIKEIEKDGTFKLLAEYKADRRKQKVNLGIGLYFNDDGSPFVFKTVKKAIKEIDKDNFNYQPIGGNPEYLKLSAELFLGRQASSRFAKQATCGGTQACHIFSELAAQEFKNKRIYIGTPSWGNYKALFRSMEIQEFPHLEKTDHGFELNYDAYLSTVKKAKKGETILIQGALAHNPTGINLSVEQLKNLCKKIEHKGLNLFMDMAYFGLSEGVKKDRLYIKTCQENLSNFALGVSFSKNASLYEQRTGALFIKSQNQTALGSQMQKIVRGSISTPPGFGQEIMTIILKKYKKEWLEEIELLRQNLDKRRQKFCKKLPSEFQSLQNTKGMFGLLPVSKSKVQSLKEDDGIYLLANGRINFAGLQKKDITYIQDQLN